MMGRRNSKLRRSIVTALGAVVLIAAPVLVSSAAFAAPEKPATEQVAQPSKSASASASPSGKAEGAQEAKAPAEKAAAKKAHSKAEKTGKAEKKKTASKGDRAAKHERRKASKKKKRSKAHRTESASKPAASASASDQGGIFLNKPAVSAKEATHNEGSFKKATASIKDAAQAGTLKASVTSKASGGEASSAKKASKKASSRAKSAKRRAKKDDSGKESSRQPCFGPAVTVDRAGLEPEHLPLVNCSGEPLTEARERLSLLARPWGVVRPEVAALQSTASRGAKTSQSSDADPLEVAPGVRRMDEGLLARLNAVARKFPGKVVSLVSGYRPQSRGSLHQTARAIDLRVAGVSNEDLAAFCKTLPDTGCGYYPNSSFIHMDVRLPGTGSVSWIDASGPGEPPRYVTKWPPSPDEEPPAPPFAPPAAGDATEMGHDLGSSGTPSAGNAKPLPLFEDPPY